MIIALIGPHAAGKSTLGRALSRRLGIPFDPELGDLLGRDPRWRPNGGTALDPQAAFDAEVFRQELARDRARGSTPRVVESWHPGNLAYAQHRSPQVAASAMSAVTGAIANAGVVLVVPLTPPVEVLLARQHEPGDPNFFQRVGRDAIAWAARLQLPTLPPLDTSAASAEDLASTLAVRIGRMAA